MQPRRVNHLLRNTVWTLKDPGLPLIQPTAEITKAKVFPISFNTNSTSIRKELQCLIKVNHPTSGLLVQTSKVNSLAHTFPK